MWGVNSLLWDTELNENYTTVPSHNINLAHDTLHKKLWLLVYHFLSVLFLRHNITKTKKLHENVVTDYTSVSAISSCTFHTDSITNPGGNCRNFQLWVSDAVGVKSTGSEFEFNQYVNTRWWSPVLLHQGWKYLLQSFSHTPWAQTHSACPLLTNTTVIISCTVWFSAHRLSNMT